MNAHLSVALTVYAILLFQHFASLPFSNLSSGISVGKSPTMNVFCQMDSVSNCSGGGWTLVMKIDGNKVNM